MGCAGHTAWRPVADRFPSSQCEFNSRHPLRDKTPAQDDDLGSAKAIQFAP
jgi:hypothetical protein